MQKDKNKLSSHNYNIMILDRNAKIKYLIEK